MTTRNGRGAKDYGVTSRFGVLAVTAAALVAAWCDAARAEIPTPVAHVFTIDVTDGTTVARGYALDVAAADGVYRIGVAATCERATRALGVWLYFGPFPASTPVQTAVRTADGRIERFGPVVSTAHGASSGFHAPQLTEPGDVVRFLGNAFTTGALVSNGHMSWWHRVPATANAEARRTLLACAGLGAP